MSEFNPEKLHIKVLNPQEVNFPRKYTLTHSDVTGDLFLSIGPDYDYEKFNNFYSKLMRDEVLGEWINEAEPGLHLHCHVSGGIAFGPVKWREGIFRGHMPLVLKAICYGDRSFLLENQAFLQAPILIHFHAKKKSLDHIEEWGTIADYLPRD